MVIPVFLENQGHYSIIPLQKGHYPIIPLQENCIILIPLFLSIPRVLETEIKL